MFPRLAAVFSTGSILYAIALADFVGNGRLPYKNEAGIGSISLGLKNNRVMVGATLCGRPNQDRHGGLPLPENVARFNFKMQPD